MKALPLITSALAVTAAGSIIAKRRSHNFAPGVVDYVDLNRYAGHWFEIARLDYKWEKHLSNCTADYSVMDNGKVKVVNRGFNEETQTWEESEGRAKFADSTQHTGALKVAFFGPFYAEYNIVSLDDDYKYALVVGKNTGYAWILSRERTIPSFILAAFLARAESIGVKTEDLIWTRHNLDNGQCD